MIRLTPPTVPGEISSGWGADRGYRGGWHAGVDFPAAKGSPILAAADGVVTYVRNYAAGDYAGKFTVIDHGGGIVSRYLHADENFKKAGDQVSRGEQIGTVGTTGTKSSAPHVHFDVKLKPDAIASFLAKYGSPTTGLSAVMRWGQGVPVETFMDKAVYRPGVIEASKKRGVVFFKPTSWLLWASVAVVGGLVWAKYRG